MKTLVLGATPNPSRYAYMAAMSLLRHGHEVVPVGHKTGKIANLDILPEAPADLEDVHTVALYLNPTNQIPYYDYIINLKPKRIIFNPGTENQELVKRARENNIEAVYSCTLVMLSVGTFDE